MKKRVYLLVHGACQGGWVWKPLLAYLDALEVFCPSLTGSGDRVHLLNPKITHLTHVEDICQIISKYQLENIYLVGHSYAGIVIAGVMESMPGKIAKGIFLDAFLPQHNQSGLDVVGEPYASEWQKAADERGERWLLPVSEESFDLWGITEEKDRVFLRGRVNDFSINFLKAPIIIDKAYERVDKCYIRCTFPSYCRDLMDRHYQAAQSQGFKIVDLPTDHEPMISNPALLGRCLNHL